MDTKDLNTTTQLPCCVRSINKSAICGIETFGSLVHCSKSEEDVKMFHYEHDDKNKLAIQEK